MISSVPLRLGEAVRWFERRATEVPRSEPMTHMACLIDELKRVSAAASKYIPVDVLAREGLREVCCGFPTMVANPDSTTLVPCPELLGHDGLHNPDRRRICPECGARELKPAKIEGYQYCTRCGRGSIPR